MTNAPHPKDQTLKQTVAELRERIRSLLYNLHGYDPGEIPLLDAQIDQTTELELAAIADFLEASDIIGGDNDGSKFPISVERMKLRAQQRQQLQNLIRQLRGR